MHIFSIALQLIYPVAYLSTYLKHPPLLSKIAVFTASCLQNGPLDNNPTSFPQPLTHEPTLHRILSTPDRGTGSLEGKMHILLISLCRVH